ncbi:MAG: 60S ribosomal export protein NMD3 [Methanoculleaceae archaeon]
MDIRKAICPRCGVPSVGLCPRCRAAEIEWLACDPVAYLVRCPVCGSVMENGVWTDPSGDGDAPLRSAVLRAVHLHKGVEPLEVDITESVISSNRSRCTVRVKGRLFGVMVESTCTLDLVIRREQCDRCNRIRGGYYEDIIQIRAAGRPVTPFERETAAIIAGKIERSLQESGERLSFISRVEEVHDGLDIVVGSHHLGQEIARQIKQRLGGAVTTHPTSVGERDGRPVYRITILVRLPFHQKGDVVVYRGRFMEVRDSGHDTLRVLDLKDRSVHMVRAAEIERTIGNVRDARDAMVTHHDRNTMGLLDPWSLEPVEVPVPEWLVVCDGGTVRVIRDTRDSLLVPVG